MASSVENLQGRFEVADEMSEHRFYDNSYHRPGMCENCGTRLRIYIKHGVKVTDIEAAIQIEKCPYCQCDHSIHVLMVSEET